MRNIEIMNQLFLIKSLLGKAGNKEIFWEDGLTVGLYEMLKIISFGNGDVKKIKNFSTESTPSITQKIQKLEEKKLLKRINCKIDKRKQKIFVTKRGEKTIERVEKKIEMVSSVIFLKYSKKEKEIFMKILKDLEMVLVLKINK